MSPSTPIGEIQVLCSAVTSSPPAPEIRETSHHKEFGCRNSFAPGCPAGTGGCWAAWKWEMPRIKWKNNGNISYHRVVTFASLYSKARFQSSTSPFHSYAISSGTTRRSLKHFFATSHNGGSNVALENPLDMEIWRGICHVWWGLHASFGRLRTWRDGCWRSWRISFLDRSADCNAPVTWPILRGQGWTGRSEEPCMNATQIHNCDYIYRHADR